MKKYGIVLVMVMFAVTALAMAPAVMAAEHKTGEATDKTKTEQTAGQMQQGQKGQMEQEQAAGKMQQEQTAGQQATGQMQSQQAAADYNQRFHSTVRGSELIGKEVVNRNDEQLGEVEDIVIGRDGRVNYLVISHGGILGIGDNLVPVPFSVVDRGEEGQERIIINASREDLENAPNFAQNEWPDFSDQNYDKNVRGYFGDEQTGGQTGMETQGTGETKSYEQETGTQMKEDQPESQTTN